MHFQSNKILGKAVCLPTFFKKRINLKSIMIIIEASNS
jgi:hypothetical protein